LGPVQWLMAVLFDQHRCDQPHLYYAPDNSGDTYFGCEPPVGWLETPADESTFEAADPQPLVSGFVGPILPEPVDKHAEDAVLARSQAGGTGATGDTGAEEPVQQAPAHAAHRSARDTASHQHDTADTGA